MGEGGVHKNLTFADGGEGGVQNGQKNADVINERPLTELCMNLVLVTFEPWFLGPWCEKLLSWQPGNAHMSHISHINLNSRSKMFEKCAEQHSLTNQHLSQGTSGMKEKLGLNLSIGCKIPAITIGYPYVFGIILYFRMI